MINGTLGTTGITVPRAFLGCGTFGGIGGARHLVGRGLDRQAAFAALDQALALGIMCSIRRNATPTARAKARLVSGSASALAN
jgi:hypothetical protein